MTDVLVVHETEILVEEAQDTVLVEQVEETEILAVAEQGPPGRTGEPGPAGGAAVQRTAGTNLSALLAVYELDGVVRALSADDALHIDLLLGITMTAAQIGELVNVQTLGSIEDSSWSWMPGRIYLGANGALTQTPPTSGFDLLIGSATSPTRIALNLQDPISLE